MEKRWTRANLGRVFPLTIQLLQQFLTLLASVVQAFLQELGLGLLALVLQLCHQNNFSGHSL